MPPIQASIYGVHAAVTHMQAIAGNLPKKTGKSLDEWIALVKASGASTVKERMAWLKAEHGLGRDTAMVIAEYTDGVPAYAPEQLVAEMYAGPKAGLLPIYEAVLAIAAGLGAEVKATPCSTYVPLLRKRTFAVIKPTTRTRVDLGLALPGVEAQGRLGLAKNLGSDRITHVIGLSGPQDVNAEVTRWLAAAYEADV
jgi:hypothetical protein